MLQIRPFTDLERLQMLQNKAFASVGTSQMLQITAFAGLGMLKRCQLQHLVLEHLKCCKLQYFKRDHRARGQSHLPWTRQRARTGPAQRHQPRFVAQPLIGHRASGDKAATPDLGPTHLAKAILVTTSNTTKLLCFRSELWAFEAVLVASAFPSRELPYGPTGLPHRFVDRPARNPLSTQSERLPSSQQPAS